MNPSNDAVPDNLRGVRCDLAAEVLRSSGKLRLCVNGWSMLPTIWPGDMLLIERVECKDVERADIVLFERHGRFFVHRVIAKNAADGTILTQGDGIPHPDVAVKSSELLGRVGSVLRAGRCFEPRRTLYFSERIVAALVRRFYWAARILVELNVMRQEEIASWQN